MKFGKLLKDGAADQADRGALYVRYGALKKQLKIMTEHMHSEKGSSASIGSDAEVDELARQLQSSAATPPHTDAAAPHRDLTVEEAAFVATLNQDLAMLNEFFIDSEEDAVIRLAFLNEQYEKTQTASDKAALKSEFVDFHGELVLLLHWSMLNYAGLVKILKKHDKLTGHLLRGPFLENALHQPFYSTEGISRLVKEVEDKVAALGTQPPTAAASPAATPPQRVVSPVELPKENTSQADILRRTAIALSMWQEMAEKASTPSTVLPPSQTMIGSPPKRQRVMPTSVAV